MTTTIRALREADKPAWRRLWTAYLDFYRTGVADSVYEITFARLLSGEAGEFRCLFAESDGDPAGLAHYLFHRHCQQEANVCYLQDLYVDKNARGMGLGRALMEAVYAKADAAGCPRVYWLTQHSNRPARRLYDKIGRVTPFVKYQRSGAKQ